MEHNDRHQAKISGFPFPSGFRDFKITNQTEQTVNRKKSGFRTAPTPCISVFHSGIEKGFEHYAIKSGLNHPQCKNLSRAKKGIEHYGWISM